MNLEEHMNNKCKFGIIKYPNGDKYIGEKQKDKKEGYGILYYNDGVRYEGEFKNNLREGYGILYYTDGDRYEGVFKNLKIILVKDMEFYITLMRVDMKVKLKMKNMMNME